MSWQSASYQWPACAQAIQEQSESVTKQIPTITTESTTRLEKVSGKVGFNRHSLSQESESLLVLREQLESLLCRGQVLSVNPYQFQVGSQAEAGHHLSPEAAIEVLSSKLLDVNDKHKPNDELYMVGWMLAKSSLADFALASRALFNAVNIPELGMVVRRLEREQSLQTDKFTKPNCIVQPRFKPTANINQQPLRDALFWQGGQLAQLESLAADKQTPVAKLKLLAQKRGQQLAQWQQAINDLKHSNAELFKFEAKGSADVLATRLKQSQPPARANNFTFTTLFISDQPLTFLSEVFA